MKILLLCACLLAVHGGDREKGLQCYREGRYAEAAAAFRAAIESEGDSADLQFNLALASWRAGDLAAAETAVEKYAAMAGDARTELHAGLLGALRHEEAKMREAEADALIAGSGQPTVAPNAPPNGAPSAAPQDPMPLLEQALQKANQSEDYFLRGVKAKATPELQRNVERSLRTIEEIEKKIEELKKQRKEQKQDDKKDGEKKPDEKNQQKQDEKKDGDKKPDDKNEPDKDQKKQDEKQNEKQDQQQGKGEEKPEPKAGEPQQQKGDEQKPQPKADESKSGEKPPSEQPEPKPGEQQDQKPRTDAPGEAAEGKELTPEQTQRLLEQLENLDAKMKSFRARAKTGRRPVERDW
jgi:hypothetical protein